MADKIEDVGAGTMPFIIKEKKYLLSPIAMGDLADFAQYVKSRRVEVIQDVKKRKIQKAKKEQSNLNLLAIELNNINKEMLEMELAVMESIVDMDREMLTFDGTRYLLWKSLSIKQPELDFEDVDKMIDMDNIEEIVKVLLKLGKKPINPTKVAEEKKK